MASNLAQLPEPEPLRAVTISHDLQAFDLLIEDMEAEVGEGWGDLDFVEALAFLRQDEAETLEFAVVAIDQTDEARLSQVLDVIGLSKRAGLKVILVADGLGPLAMHQLLRAGADDFVPYPLPENALSDAVARARKPGVLGESDLMRRAVAGTDTTATAAVVAQSSATEPAPPPRPGGATEGAVFAVQSASGGNGATTIAVNLAWEMAHIAGPVPPRVCIIDLGLQFGSVATYLDLPRKPTVFEVLSDITSMDAQAFRQSLTPYRDRMQVFTAPAEVLPLDVIGPEEVAGLLKLARASFDFVVVDMPTTVTGWTDTVLKTCDIFFLCCELEVRSAQNALRFQHLLQGERIDTDRLAYLLNKAPGKMGMGGRARIEKFSSSLGVKFHAILPDGGRQVTEVNDQAAPLRELAARNPLTREVARLARELHAARDQVEGNAAAPAKKKAIFGLKFG